MDSSGGQGYWRYPLALSACAYCRQRLLSASKAAAAITVSTLPTIQLTWVSIS